MTVVFEHFRTTDVARFAQARAIRDVVFIQEQSVPVADEWDDFEDDATHFLMWVDGAPLGTARVRILGEVAKLERIAICKPARGRGYGALLMAQLLEFATHQSGVTQAKLSSQTHAIAFYEQHGFRVCSEEYMDAGIPHQMMVRQIR